MINSDAVVEAMIKDKGLTAPRVMPKMIDAMVSSLIFKVMRFEGSTVMVAAAFLPTGFEVGTGKSACASPENFNAEIGEKIAVDNARAAARDKLWELEGYVLHKQLTTPTLNFKERAIQELSDLMAKVNALAAFLVVPFYATLPEAEQDQLQRQYDAMLVYARVLADRIEAF